MKYFFTHRFNWVDGITIAAAATALTKGEWGQWVGIMFVGIVISFIGEMAHGVDR